MAKRIRIGTRGSKLALWQTRWVAAQLEKTLPETSITIEEIRTLGDKVQDVPLASMGGQGVFTRELDSALLSKSVDMAVHSLKDIPTQMPEGILLAAIPPREDPRDAFLAYQGQDLASLPPESAVAAGSARRQALLLMRRPDLKPISIRGNIDTRLRKLQAGEGFRGMILACAGLRRLGLEEHITEVLDPESWIPAPGQGALAITIRSDDKPLAESLRGLHCPESAAQVTAERSLLRAVEGGCHAPVGAWAQCSGSHLRLKAILAAPDASSQVTGVIEGSMQEAASLGEKLALDLLARGGDAIMAQLQETDTME